jgi:hypothetical protein
VPLCSFEFRSVDLATPRHPCTPLRVAQELAIMTVAAETLQRDSAGLDGAARVAPHRPVHAAAGPSPADLGHLLRILGGWESAAGQLVVVQRNSRQVRGPRAVGEAPPHRERACAAHLCRGLSAAGDGPEWTARNAQTWWTSWLLWRMPFGARPASLACSLCSRHARHQLPVLGIEEGQGDDDRDRVY